MTIASVGTGVMGIGAGRTDSLPMPGLALDDVWRRTGRLDCGPAHAQCHGATVHHMGWGELNATAVFKVFEVMAGMAPDASAARAAG